MFDIFCLKTTISGRHYYGNERDEKRWKANFRCALNSLKTVKPVSKTLKGQNAFREYRIMDMLDTVPDEVKPTTQGELCAFATIHDKQRHRTACTDQPANQLSLIRGFVVPYLDSIS